MTHYTGMILSALREAMNKSDLLGATDRITVLNHQQNGSHGVHQATVRLANDPITYRLILAPANAPIEINGRPVDDHFAAPLGED